MVPKILITGSNGLLGQKLVHHLVNKQVEVLATSKGENRIAMKKGYRYLPLDITDKEAVMQLFRNEKPDTVINTAAMTNVDACEQEKAGCRLLNVTAVEHLTEACKPEDAHLIHLSTDFVFDGKAGPYTEEDEPAPLSFYGQSKLDSEKIVIKSGLTHWSIVRTIIVYGVADAMSRSNIVLWAKAALESGKEIRIVNDQFRTPTLAEDLAEGCARIALQKAKGIYHLSGKDFMSILELVKRVATAYQLPWQQIHPVTSDQLRQTAARPLKTGFILDKARREIGYNPHSFEEGLRLLAKQTQVGSSLNPHASGQ